MNEGVLTAADALEIEKRASCDIEAAVEFALSSPEPSLDEVATDVYA